MAVYTALTVILGVFRADIVQTLSTDSTDLPADLGQYGEMVTDQPPIRPPLKIGGSGQKAPVVTSAPAEPSATPTVTAPTVTATPQEVEAPPPPAGV